MWTFVLSIFTPGRRYSNVFTWSFRLIFPFSTHTLSKPAWIFFTTDSASSHLMLSFYVAVNPEDKLLRELLESKGLCLLNQAYIFLRSSLSRFLLATSISTCCSLLLCCKPVKLHIPLWIFAQRCVLCTHNSLTDSVTLRPVVSLPRLFNRLIRTCSIVKSIQRPAQYLSLRQTVWYPRSGVIDF